MDTNVPVAPLAMVDFAATEERVIAHTAGPPDARHLVFGSGTYAGVVSERNALRRCLINQTRMLACWAPECFPAAPNGQVHFARALMESAAQEMATAAGVPYPNPDPAESPVNGVLDLMERIAHALAAVNGVYARDTDQRGPALEWQVDVAAEISDIEALISRMRKVPI